MGQQFERRSIDKTYLALVAGEIAEDAGVMAQPLGKALGSEVRLKMGVREDGDGLPSRTEWKVARRLSGYTLVELHPLTGRQHQLRVHLAAIGHPILGDKLYMGDEQIFIRSVSEGITEADREFLMMDRQALHNWKLVVDHPFTGARLELVAPLFQDIAEQADLLA
jgi:23S rRNA pseudouridine1911/1915/1917 synthase